MKRDFNSNRRDDSRGRNNYRGKPNSQASHKRGSGNSDRRDSDRRDSNRRNSDRRNPDRRDGFRGRKISRGGRSSDSRNYSRR